MFKNYLVTEDKTIAYGYKMVEKKGGMVALEKENNSLIFKDYNGKKEKIRMDADVYKEKVYGKNIGFRPKPSGLTPYITDMDEYLHRLAINVSDGKECDHIDHNRCNCVKENLRPVNSEQNRYNTISTITKITGHFGDYTYIKSVSASDILAISKLEGKGFRKLNSRKDRINMISPSFSTPRDAYSHMRDINELLYGEYAYRLERDFCHEYGMDLIISCYCFGMIPEAEMYVLNRAYWEEYWREKGMPDIIAYAR